MSKQSILNETRQNTAQTFQTQDLRSLDAKPDVLPVIEREKANRVSRSRQLDVLEYQPCVDDSALPLIKSWHLLFFARTGTTHIQDLRRALQREIEPDVQLMKRFKSVQAQYRQHMARESQSVSESVASQPVIAEIRYGGLSVVSSFWLPEDMEMGLSLVPRTGARLCLERLTLVEHCQPGASQSLEVLLVTATQSRTRAELATQQPLPVDFLDTQKRIFTFSTPTVLVACPWVAAGLMFLAATASAVEAIPTKLSSEESLRQQAEFVRNLGQTPSVSQLLETRERVLAGKKAKIAEI